ncbi:MAG: SIS domain-containing protein [Erysipelotrichaceae bacterium]|nr:SIS domain-containing protein [Erysipelotrichaceae bacterium]
MTKTRISMDLFKDELKHLLNVLYEKENKNIAAAAKLCADCIEQQGVVQVFGSGHSVGFGMEMHDRIGDLVPVHQIDTADFVLKGKVTLADFKDPVNIFERRPGIADKLYDLYNIGKEDVFIIISNSGINGVVIDLAITAKERGHKVIVVTSWQHTTAEDSRHPSGKKLYEFADVVIDNCGPQGDALLDTEKNERICSVSSITGAMIAQTIGTETVRILMEKGAEVPVLWDEALEGSKEHNQKLRNQYQGRI